MEPFIYADAPCGGDDLPGLTTKLRSLEGQHGGLLLLRPGVYSVSGTPVVPNKVTMRGVARSGTTLRAGTGFPAGAPLVQLGPTSGYSFASRAERMSLDCNSVGVGVYSSQAQEFCGVDQVTVSGFTDTGIHFDGGSADFALDNVECYPAASGANYGIHLHNSGSNIVRKATVGVSGHLAAGVFVNGGEAVLQSVHVENCTDGILYDGTYARGFAYGVSGPTSTANVTNLVRMAANSGGYVTLVDLTKGEATNTIVDQVYGRTITDPLVQLAVLGDAYLAQIHSPQLDALTARVAALEART